MRACPLHLLPLSLRSPLTSSPLLKPYPSLTLQSPYSSFILFLRLFSLPYLLLSYFGMYGQHTSPSFPIPP